ncbi:TKL protein kinase [Saprolegnia diclina VS20]|uniref:TKL protein kinase n=1 Tax=Saprolegnia diclina (strain VS20) TaxID=1156394 RepID=T0PUX5_SAPDV|nr:TKL protein kinase [Saprolegnia diclina VS20]EQC29324.1 TKL protein kinase [Saprolegnia diclina VS20]|eukprot:XP_008617298.1 TKL protein kinase [Saprolegnia diclina VS20]
MAILALAMLRVLAVASLLWASVGASTTTCPYSHLNATSVLVSNELCKTFTAPCLVSSTSCVVKGSATLTPRPANSFKDGPGWYIVDAVGDMSTYSAHYLSLNTQTSPAALDLSTMVLPESLETFAVEGAVTLPRHAWPSTLTSLQIGGTEKYDLPMPSDLPSSVTSLKWDGMKLTKVPTIAPQWLSLSLARNPITEIVNLDISSLVYFSLWSAPLTKIENITFSPKLNYLSFSGRISTFTLSKIAFDILNGLSKVSNGVGYELYMCSVNIDTAACTQSHGVVSRLWAKDPDANFAVCVVRDVGVIAGAAAAGVVVVLLIGCCLWKRRQSTPSTDDGYHAPIPLQTLSKSGNHSTGQATDTMLAGDKSRPRVDVDLDSLCLLRLVPSELQVLGSDPLAAGAHGEVWRGTYAQQPVAVKRSKDKSAKAIAKMSAEILLMAKMDCPYIVSLIGASWLRPTDLECVVELMDLGDLRSFLSSTAPLAYNWAQKQESVSDVVQGLVYLHTFDTPIIHRDLKSRNVLLDSKKGTKLTDFGESREMDEETLTNGIGTYQWMAPEIFTGHDYSTAADVYSFGVLLSEYSTHRVPYADMINPRTNKPMNQQFIMHQVTSGAITPTFDTTTTPTWVLELSKQCLAFDPEDRPSMLSVFQVVRTTLAI